MVFDPERKPVSVRRMIIYSFIPFLNIYAAWRIQKFWVLLGLGIAARIVIDVAAELSTIEPYILAIIATVLYITFSVLIVRHYAIKYNEKIKSDK